MTKVTVSDAGHKGGTTTLKKYGKQHFSTIAKQRMEQIKKNDPEYFSRMGKKSAEARKKKKLDSDSALSKIAKMFTG